MGSYAFGLTTPRDFLQKARREVQRLEQATEEAHLSADVAYLQDTAINAALTLWHISDWIANSPDESCKNVVERIRKERKWSPNMHARKVVQDHILDDSFMALCEALANGAKHLSLHEPPRLDPTRLTRSAGPYAGMSAVTIEATVTQRAAREGDVPLHFAKLRINEDGLPALDAFKAALAYWQKFFDDFGL